MAPSSDLATANVCALVQTLHAHVAIFPEQARFDLSLTVRLLRAAADACLRLKQLSLVTSDPFIDVSGHGALPCLSPHQLPSLSFKVGCLMKRPSVPVACAVCFAGIVKLS